MTDIAHLIELLTVLVLAVFVGFEVISKVPTTLHTPLMSATNAIHGIVLAGAIVIVARLFDRERGAGLDRARDRRGDARRDQRLRRLRRDRTHAADVPPQGAAASDRDRDRNRRSPISWRSRSSSTGSRAELARDRTARQPLCDGRHGRSRSSGSSCRRAPSAGGRSPSASRSAAIVGIYAAVKVKMTAMPQMVALYNGAGGGAAALDLDRRIFHRRKRARPRSPSSRVSLVLSAIIGAISFRRLDRRVPQAARAHDRAARSPIPASSSSTCSSLLAIVGTGGLVRRRRSAQLPAWAFVALLVGALLLGVLFVLPIGGADMPVVISLLNSFTGVAVAITGFEIDSTLLIICGALVGASGTILTVAMSRAMNRPLTNVLFGAFGAAGGREVAVGGRRPAANPQHQRRRRRRHARVRDRR